MEVAHVPVVAALVLVVEDDWLLRHSLVQELRFAGFRVIEAATGEEAIALLEDGRQIDILITDINLPGDVCGWDIARTYRRALPKIPVIYASAAEHDDKRRVPGSTFFSKPYQTAEVVEAACHTIAG